MLPQLFLAGEAPANGFTPDNAGKTSVTDPLAYGLLAASGLVIRKAHRKMQLDFPLRLSATGIIGLAALSATHWLRDNVSEPGVVLAFAMGVLPNLAAAFAMPLILASFTRRTSRAPAAGASRAAYVWVLLFTTGGLCGWELVQTQSARFVFDVYDILATGLGSALAYIAYVWHARSFEAQAHTAAARDEA